MSSLSQPSEPTRADNALIADALDSLESEIFAVHNSRAFGQVPWELEQPLKAKLSEAMEMISEHRRNGA